MFSSKVLAIIIIATAIALGGELSSKIQKVDSEFNFRYKQRTLQIEKQFITLRGSEDEELKKRTLAYHLEFVIIESARIPIRLVQLDLYSGGEKLATIGLDKIKHVKAWGDSKVYVSVSLEDIPLLLLDDVDLVRVY